MGILEMLLEEQTQARETLGRLDREVEIFGKFGQLTLAEKERMLALISEEEGAG